MSDANQKKSIGINSARINTVAVIDLRDRCYCFKKKRDVKNTSTYYYFFMESEKKWS